MRLSPVWITGILVAALYVGARGPYAQGQSTGSKDAQASEAKGMPPRATPGDYPAQALAGSVTIAAEFMGHSVPRPEGPLSTDDYVVVETGLFGSPQAHITLSIEDFSLRINGKKTPLSSQPYGLVVRSLKDPEWLPPEPAQPKSKGGLNTGQGDSNSPPPIVHVPIELQRAMALHLQKSALPEGERTLPQAGLIFFQYRSRTQSIHSIELLYNGPAGKATLALHP
jgi:hypothetical protein